jgi:hypothetical protein
MIEQDSLPEVEASLDEPMRKSRFTSAKEHKIALPNL